MREKMKKEFYKRVELKFDALNHKQSWFFDKEKFYPLKDMLQAIKDQKAIKEKVYINSMNHWERRSSMGAIDMAEHRIRVRDSDISKPIIINYDWTIVDWYHRIVKAITMKKDYLWAYRISPPKLIPKTLNRI